MNIVKKDTRELTDISPINFQADEIIFSEMRITWNFARWIEEMVKWNFYFVWENTQKVELNLETNVFDMWWNFFVIEYDNRSLRDNDIDLLKQNFEEDWKFAKELEKKRQIPTFDWYFEYDWKFYTIVDWLNKLTGEINSRLGIYKWVIVNPLKYFSFSNNNKEISNKVDWIINNS